LVGGLGVVVFWGNKKSHFCGIKKTVFAKWKKPLCFWGVAA
jgi:hypothetical protein